LTNQSIFIAVKGDCSTREIVPLAKHDEAVAVKCFTKAEVKMLRDRLYDNTEPLAR
jgi:MarR family transcriptional regulator, organic hydroperoxide resistance regulator